MTNLMIDLRVTRVLSTKTWFLTMTIVYKNDCKKDPYNTIVSVIYI